MNPLSNNFSPSDDRPSFRFSNPLARVTLGVLASAAVFAASALVFGPVSDQRALAMANPPALVSYPYAGVVDDDGHPGAPRRLAEAAPHADERSIEPSIRAGDRRISTN